MRRARPQRRQTSDEDDQKVGSTDAQHNLASHCVGVNFLPHLFYSSEEVAEAKPPHFLHPLILHCRLTAKMFHTASIRLCIKLIHRQTSLQLTPFHVFLLQDSGCCLPKANCKYNARNSVLYLNTFSYTKPYCSLCCVSEEEGFKEPRRPQGRYPESLPVMCGVKRSPLEW